MRGASVSNVDQDGVSLPSAPLTNRGGKAGNDPSGESDQSVTDRHRVNVSLPGGVYAMLGTSAGILGAPISQVCLGLIMSGLPDLAEQVRAVQALDQASGS